jgi:hypothetical protein
MMRFFSNDAREAPDDQTPDDRASDERPDRVQSEPVAVPGQRPPSPWATPAEAGTPAAVPADAYHRDENTVDDPDRTQAYEPGGYGSVPETAPRSDPDGVVESPSERNTSTYAASTATAPDPDATTALPTDRRDDDDDAIVDVPLDDTDDTGDTGATDEARGGTDVTDRALRDEGGFEDPQAVDPGTSQPLATPPREQTREQDRDQDREQAGRADAAIKDEGGFDDPQVVQTAAEVTPVPAPTTPAPASAARGSDTLFAAQDASGLKERWRDVQLRFVDSPKEATEEAAKLVEEAVDKLTASLKSRNKTGGDGDDTEALRVRLRSYRDTLDRILGL